MTATDPDVRVTAHDFNTIENDGWGIDDEIPLPGETTIVESSWTPLNLAELPDKPPVQPTLGGVGLVYPGKRHVFSGPQESAKTVAAYAIGLQVVREEGVLILIDFEMGAYDARDRLRELGAADEELDRIRYLEPHEPADQHTMPRLLNLDPALVVVDAAAGAYDLQGLDDNKRQDVERFTGLYVRAFWQAGVATIVLDHVVKNTELRGRYTIGSERKVGGADVHLGFDVITPISRGGHGLYKISTHKDRGGFLKRGHLANLELASDPETHAIGWMFKAAETTDEEGHPQPLIPTVLMERISIYLELQTEPVSQRTILNDIVGKEKFLVRALEILTARGHITQSAGPRNAKLFTSSNPYRQLEEPIKTDLRPTDAPLTPGAGQMSDAHLRPPLQGAGEGASVVHAQAKHTDAHQERAEDEYDDDPNWHHTPEPELETT